jgi:hypothetical protein
MSRRLDWDKLRLHGRPTLDYRHEHDKPDAADRWIAKALSRQPQRQRPVPAAVRRRTLAIAEQLGESSNWVTADSTGVPW